MELCVYKHSQVPDAVRAWQKFHTQFVIKTMPVCLSAKGSDPAFVDIGFM